MVLRSLILGLLLSSLLFAPHAQSTPRDVAYILEANSTFSDMLRLEKSIQALSQEEIADEVVIEKLVSIVAWKRSYVFKNNAIYLRRVKRAATDRLLTLFPKNSTRIQKLATALDHELIAHHDEQLVIDTSNYSLIVELLSSWSALDNETATEELVKALESSIYPKILETELAISLTQIKDPRWLINLTQDHQQRIRKALGRPWVMFSLQNSYRNELRFKHHALAQLTKTFDSPTLSSLQSIESQLNMGIEDASYFSFFQTLILLDDWQVTESEKKFIGDTLTKGIEKLLTAYPELRSNAFCAALLLDSITKYELHSPYIDKLVATWLETPFLLHDLQIKGHTGISEKQLIRSLRIQALKHLIQIQKNYHFAKHTQPFERIGPEKQKIVHFEFLKTLIKDSFTALDPEALHLALNCADCDPVHKLDLLDFFMMEDKTLQDLVIQVSKIPAAQEKALNLLNGVQKLSTDQLTLLGSILGIHSPDEAQLYLGSHTNLRRMFKEEWNPPVQHVGPIRRAVSALTGCAAKIAAATIRRAIR